MAKMQVHVPGPGIQSPKIRIQLRLQLQKQQGHPVNELVTAHWPLGRALVCIWPMQIEFGLSRRLRNRNRNAN